MPGNRNSCFKIDPDVTFMHIKYDYYKHTNVFKSEYIADGRQPAGAPPAAAG